MGGGPLQKIVHGDAKANSLLRGGGGRVRCRTNGHGKPSFFRAKSGLARLAHKLPTFGIM